MTEKVNRPFSASALKIIACVTMLIDHLGLVVFGNAMLLRLIGRIAMPIYCFLLTEGAIHTRNKAKYIGRMLLFAFLSEIPFDLAVYDRCFYWGYQNVMFTLTLGLLCIFGMDHCRKKLPRAAAVIISILLLTAGSALAELIESDYGLVGVWMIVVFYLFKNHSLALGLSLFFVVCPLTMLRSGSFGIPTEIFALFALIPIGLYNGKKGISGNFIKYAFYAFYPVHLLLLGLWRVLT